MLGHCIRFPKHFDSGAKGEKAFSLEDKLRAIEKGNGDFGERPDVNSYGCPKAENLEEFLASRQVTGIFKISKHELGTQECLSAYAHKLADRLGLFTKDDIEHGSIEIQSTPFETPENVE